MRNTEGCNNHLHIMINLTWTDMTDTFTVLISSVYKGDS